MELPVDKEEDENCQFQALTSIHAAYTLAATNESETSEVETVIIRHFTETLAEIALSVASRKQDAGNE